MSLDLLARILRLEQRLDNLVKPEKGWTPHFLTDPYTNADFNGDAFSDVAAHTVIENTSWSTAITANAKALLIRATVRDSDSAGTAGLAFSLYGAAAAVLPTLELWLNGMPNDQWVSETCIVPATDGDIWYTINASGANTLDVYLFCCGWWE